MHERCLSARPKDAVRPTIPRRSFFAQTAGCGLGLTSLLTNGQSKARAASNSKKKILIGQIGTRHGHASGKMTAIRKFPDDFEVVGIVEPDAQRRRQVQDTPAYRDLKWLSEEQLLNTSGLQAVAVETAVRDLVPTAARCVAAGMHVHLDKPAGDSLSQFKNVLDNASAQRLVVQMGYMLRYNPAFQFLFRAVRAGWLGEIFEVHGVISKTVGAESRLQIAEFAGGTMFELGCHLIDTLVALMGEPDSVTPFVRHTRPEQDTLADNQLAVFEYPEATATIRSALMEVDGFRRRQFVVCGDRGTIDIRPLEPPNLTLTLADAQGDFAKGTTNVRLPRSTGRYDDEFADLARFIRGDEQPKYGPAHDLAVHEAVLRASGMLK